MTFKQIPDYVKNVKCFTVFYDHNDRLQEAVTTWSFI